MQSFSYRLSKCVFKLLKHPMLKGINFSSHTCISETASLLLDSEQVNMHD